ncbi:MAG: hypothetical protein OEQ53_10125 [Saprospiraceae bacterium]|nr:hypothetical protein [Saprospiraceae bacterium]
MSSRGDLRSRVRDDRISIAICLLISLLAWLAIKLSNEYNHTFRFPVAYETPAELAFDRVAPTDLTAQLRAKGWTFLNMSMGQGRDTIRIPVIASGVMPSLPVLQEQLPIDLSEQITVLNITPMQLDLRLSEKISKRVPIIPAEDLTTASQYQFAGKIIVSPDSVTLSGTSRLLTPLAFWPTKPFLFEPLTESFEGEIELSESSSDLIKTNVEHCIIKATVEQITEKQIYVPITIVDSLKSSIQIFPDQALIKCTVGLSRFEDVERNAFKVSAVPDPSLDQKQWLVQITKLPEFVTLIDYSPKTVEFFLINP